VGVVRAEAGKMLGVLRLSSAGMSFATSEAVRLSEPKKKEFFYFLLDREPNTLETLITLERIRNKLI
jgi:hypothetical protein